MHCIHLFWSSWWKPHSDGGFLSGEPRLQYFWKAPEPDVATAKAEWEQLWHSLSLVGSVRRLHITIFQVISTFDASTLLQTDELLPALCKVRADEYFVEAWAEEEKFLEPSAARPFRLHLNPALGRPR